MQNSKESSLCICSCWSLGLVPIHSSGYKGARRITGTATTYSSAVRVSEILYQLSCKWFPVPSMFLSLIVQNSKEYSLCICSCWSLGLVPIHSSGYKGARRITGTATTYSSAVRVSEILYQLSCKWFSVPSMFLSHIVQNSKESSLCICSCWSLGLVPIHSSGYKGARRITGTATTYSSAVRVSEILYQLSCKWFSVPSMCLSHIVQNSKESSLCICSCWSLGLVPIHSSGYKGARQITGTGNHLQLSW